MKVLVIWDQIGSEPIRCFEMTGKWAETALQANSHYVNDDSEEGDAVEHINDLLLMMYTGEIKVFPKGIREVEFGKGLLNGNGGTSTYDAISVCGCLP